MAAFISFEGIDGSGKTTQLKLLETHLRSQKLPVLLAREPGGTEVGESIRQILLHSKTTHLTPLSELLLYYASRHQNLHQKILPARNAGHWVLCDRFADASMAYQGYGRGIDLAVVESLNKVVIGNHWPDLTVLIDIDPVLSLGRARDRNRNDTVDEGRFERESLDFFARVRHGYLEIARKDPGRVRVVSGEQPVETLHREIVGLLIQTHSTEFQTGFR
jgi:dTMP kinase